MNVKKILPLFLVALVALPAVGVAADTWPGSQYLVTPINWGAVILGVLLPLALFVAKGDRAKDVPNMAYLLLGLVGAIAGQFLFAGVLPSIGFAVSTPSPTPTPTPTPTPSTPTEVTGNIQVYVKNWLDGTAITSNAIGFLVAPSVWTSYGGDPIKILAAKKNGLINLPVATVDSSGKLTFIGFSAKKPYSKYYVIVTDSSYSSGYTPGSSYAVAWSELKVYPQKDINGNLAVSPGYVSLAKLGDAQVIDEQLNARTKYTWVYNGSLDAKTFSFNIVPDVPSNPGTELQAWAVYYKVDTATVPSTGATNAGATGSMTVDQILINGKPYTAKKISDLDPNDPLYVNKPSSDVEYVVYVGTPGFVRNENNYDTFTVTMKFTSTLPATNVTISNSVTFYIVQLASGKNLGTLTSTFQFVHANAGTPGWG